MVNFMIFTPSDQNILDGSMCLLKKISSERFMAQNLDDDHNKHRHSEAFSPFFFIQQQVN
jgi:hypothetical protein